MSRRLVTEEDAERLVTVTVGDDVVIELAQRGGTGFLWSLPDLPGWLSLTRDSVRHSAVTPGAASVRVIELRATAAGSADVTLTLAQPWAGGETERQTRYRIAAVDHEHRRADRGQPRNGGAPEKRP